MAKKLKKELSKHVNPTNAGLILSEELKKMENVEHLGTSIYHTSQQFYLLIQSILLDKYGFTEKQLKELNVEVKKAVEGLAWFEEKGLNPLSPYSIAQLVDVTLHHYQEFKANKAGIELPTNKRAAKLLHKENV